jgi:flagellar hook-associated protein 3 FlgL
MSAISSAGYPGLAQVLAGLTQTRKHLDTLTQQAASGFVSDTYAGLNGAAPVALSLSPRIDSLQASQNNIDAASGPAQVTQIAMTRIQAITANLVSQLPSLNGLSSTAVDTVAASARDALSQVANLLNSQYGDVYVFAGQDSSNPPVPNADQIGSSAFFTQISAAVGGLSVNGAASTAATTLAIAGSGGTSPFSTYLSQPVTSLSTASVATGDGQSQSIGLLASGNTSALSTGTSTTGSYMRDLMRALATVGSMSSSQMNDPGFAALVEDTRASVTDATSAMSTDVGILGQQQSNLTTMKSTLNDTMIAMTGQLTSAQNVDMARTLSELTLTQTQLQASYQLIATTSGLSLAKFLPAA